MKTLAVFDSKDYEESAPHNIRNAVRAIIINNNKIALLYSEKYEFYHFPGGGVDKGESNIDALIREVKEETGLIVRPQSIKEYGMIAVIKKDLVDLGIYDLRHFFYFCDVEKDILKQELTSSEKESKYRLTFVSAEEAISKNELDLHLARKYTEPEIYVLKLLRDNFAV